MQENKHISLEKRLVDISTNLILTKADEIINNELKEMKFNYDQMAGIAVLEKPHTTTLVLYTRESNVGIDIEPEDEDDIEMLNIKNKFTCETIPDIQDVNKFITMCQIDLGDYIQTNKKMAMTLRNIKLALMKTPAFIFTRIKNIGNMDTEELEKKSIIIHDTCKLDIDFYKEVIHSVTKENGGLKYVLSKHYENSRVLN